MSCLSCMTLITVLVLFSFLLFSVFEIKVHISVDGRFFSELCAQCMQVFSMNYYGYYTINSENMC